MSDTTAKELAWGFLNFCKEHGDLLTNLKLQKLLYYAQGWYLAFHDRPAFDDQLEAWIHGPVVREIYHEFKGFGGKPITAEAPKELSLVREVTEHIADVWTAYGHFTAYDLELMSHREPPWVTARGNLPPDAGSNAPLDIEVMRTFFKSKLG